MNHRDTKAQRTTQRSDMHGGDACSCRVVSVPLCYCNMQPVARRAFTFFELLVVLVILATVLGMLAPNLRGFFFAHQTHEKALHLLALMRHARSQAVTQGITHRLTIDLTAHEYYLQQRVDGKFVELGNSLGQTFAWPDAMTVTFESDTQQNDPIQLTFTPQGTVTSGKITITGQDDEKGYVLRSLTSSEPYVLKTFQQDQLEDQ